MTTSTPPPLSPSAELALGHIRGRSRSDRFACQHYEMREAEWIAAIEELRAHGHVITSGTVCVADDPGLTVGWVIEE